MRRSTASGGRTAGLPGGFTLVTLLLAVGLLVPLFNAAPVGADQVGDSRARAARLAAELRTLSERESQLAEAYDAAQLHLADTTTRLEAARAALSQTDGQLSGARARVRDMAVDQYVQGGAARQLSLLIPSSATEIAVRGTYVRSVTASTNDAVDALHAAGANLARLQADLVAAQADATRALAAVQATQKAAAGASTSVAAAYAQAEAQLGRDELAKAQADAAAAEQTRIQQQLAASRQRAGAGGGGIAVAPLPGRHRSGGVSPVPVSTTPLPPPGPGAASALAFARAELGKPYVYGGGGPDAFDCSGLTAWAWGHAGHPLPHSSEAQYYDTTHVSVADLQPGDLVFWGMPPHHVGLYVGGGMMIDALHSGTNVQYDSIYMESDLIGGGRVN